MIVLSITEKGDFMTKLLSKGAFDSFLLESARIDMGVTYEIDGHINSKFYTKEELEAIPWSLVPWSEVQEHCRSCMKGKKAPSAFSIVLHLKDDFVPGVLKDVPDALSSIAALVINIRLTEEGLRLITAVSRKGFSLDKQAEPVWDQTMRRFLDSKQIRFEEL